MNNLIGIQIIGILFALSMLYITFLHLRRKEFTTKETLFWAGSWLIFMLLVIVPNILDFFISDVLKFSRRIDFFVVLGFMFLIGTTFYIYTLVRKNQNKIERIVRKIAIEKEK